MARAACKAARRRGIEETPLILLTHSKSFYAFGNFDRFLGRLAREPGMTFSRTRDCVVRLGQNALPRLPLQREARANAFGTHAAGAAAV